MPRKKLQLHQFEVNRENIIDKTLYVYRWPERLLEYIAKNTKDYKLEHPIKNLSKIISMSLDDVVYVRSRVANTLRDPQNDYWIFSLDKINIDVANSLIADWINANEMDIDIHFENMLMDNPVEIDTRQMFDEEKLKSDVYSIIPQLYNIEFCKGAIEIPSINRMLEFYPVIDDQSEGTAISEPFEHETYKGNIEKFSYATKLRLVGSYEHIDKRLLNIYTGIKVWKRKPLIENGKSFIKGGSAHSMYFYKESEYMRNENKKLLQLMYRRDKEKGFRYKEYSDEKISQIYGLNFEEALKNPNEFNSDIGIAGKEIYMITNTKKTEEVESGAGLPERIDVFNSLENRFPELIKVDRIMSVMGVQRGKSKKKKSLGEMGLYKKYEAELNYLLEEKGRFFYENPPILNSTSEKVYIEVYTKNQDLFDAFIEFSRRILSLDFPITKNSYRSCDGFEVIFVLKIDDIARELSEQEVKDKKLREIEIYEKLKMDDYDSNHVLSFVDIHAFHNEKSKALQGKDPKKIIRKKFMENGRVTQFINGFNLEKDKIKLANAVYDLLSAGGFLDNKYIECGFSDKILLGLSAVPSSRGKLIALSKIYNGKVEYKVYGLHDESWLPMSEILKRFEKGKIGSIMKEKTDGVRFNDWVVRQLSGIGEESVERYLYFDAALRNNIWSFAGNTKLDIENLRILNKDRFRFIRVNTTTEIPEYNILKDENDTEGINRRQGLFSNGNGVFYSVGARSDNMKKTSKYATKLTSTKNMIGKQKAVEYVILSKEEVDMVEIAKESHVLRNINLTFDFSTKYPMPIYVNERFGEYIESMEI